MINNPYVFLEVNTYSIQHKPHIILNINPNLDLLPIFHKPINSKIPAIQSKKLYLQLYLSDIINIRMTYYINLRYVLKYLSLID